MLETESDALHSLVSNWSNMRMFPYFIHFFRTMGVLCKRSAKQWGTERKRKQQQKSIIQMYAGLQIKVMQTSEKAQAHTDTSKQTEKYGEWYGKALSKSVRIKHKWLGHFFFQTVNEDERDREKNNNENSN